MVGLGRDISHALLIQGLGLAAFALVNIIFARSLGVAGQAYFSSLRALTDLGLTIGLFGFPQSMAYWVAQHPGSARKLVVRSLQYGFVSVPIAALALWVGMFAGVRFLSTFSYGEIVVTGTI